MGDAALLDTVVEAVADRLNVHHQKQGSLHALIYRFDEGRTQLVTICNIQSWTNRPIVLIYSIIGRFRNELDFKRLLSHSLTANYSRVCMVQDEYLGVAASMDIEETEKMRLVSGLELRIKEVALFADNLEQEFYGADEF